MNMIALETSGSYLSFALMREGSIVNSFHKKVGLAHEVIFWREFPKRFKASGLLWEDLDYVAVTRGPGRFTGVRFALALANAWSRLYGIPLFAPSVIDLMAWRRNQRELSYSVIASTAKQSHQGILYEIATAPPVAGPRNDRRCCLVAYSGAWVGAIGSKKIEAFGGLDDYVAKVLRADKAKTRKTEVLYWAEDSRIPDIAKVFAAHKDTINLKFFTPNARDLLAFAQSAKAAQFFSDSIAKPIYLKESWK